MIVHGKIPISVRKIAEVVLISATVVLMVFVPEIPVLSVQKMAYVSSVALHVMVAIIMEDVKRGRMSRRVGMIVVVITMQNVNLREGRIIGIVLIA